MSKIEVRISNRHVHLHQDDLDILFGQGYQLTEKRSLGSNEFAANETVSVTGPKGTVEAIRILAPVRRYTQVELLRSDTFVLGVDAPIAESVESCDPVELTLTGPKGKITKKCGMIAWRHIHISAKDAVSFGLKDQGMVSVETKGDRGLIFNKVLVRFLDQKYDKYNITPVMHVDVEEANAAGLNNGDLATIVTSL